MNAGRRTDPEKTLVWMNQMMKDTGVTVPQIAEWLGISENQVYNWRGGKIGMKKLHFLALAYCFDYILHKDLGDFIYITTPERPVKYEAINSLFDSLCLKPEDISKGA